MNVMVLRIKKKASKKKFNEVKKKKKIKKSLFKKDLTLHGKLQFVYF
jgi:hypothetical protein